MDTLRDPRPGRRTARWTINLKSGIGEPAWRAAAAGYDAAQRCLQRIGPHASERVVPMQRFRKGSPEAFEHLGRLSRACREAAVRVLFAPAPSPRELANKIRLLAYVHGLADPIGRSNVHPNVHPMMVERAVKDGWAPLEDILGQLCLDAQLLEQYHDADAFKKARKRRRKKEGN